MIDAAAIRRSGARRALFDVGGTRALDGERLAVAVTAAAVAMLPLLVPRGPANTSPVDVLIALALSTCLFWAGTSGHRWRFPYAVPMSLFIAGGALGALAGPLPRSGIVALSQDIMLLAWCWAVINIGFSPEKLKVLLATWAYSSIGWAALLFAALATGSSSLTGQSTTEGSRTALTFGNPNVSASYYFISIMIIWASGCPRRRGLRFVAYGLLLAALVSTGSNSGIVSLIVGTAVATLVGVYRRAGVVPAVTALAFLVLGGSLVASNVSLEGIQERAHGSRYAFVRDGLGRSQGSEVQRRLLLSESVELYQTGGPLGQGPVSTKAILQTKLAPFAKEAHDDYFAALIERGVLGLLGILLLVFSLGLRALSLARRRLAEGYRAVVIRPNALVGAVAGTVVASTTNEFFHVRHVWTLFAFVAALSAWGVYGSAGGDGARWNVIRNLSDRR
jgi:hypothetical protein